MKRLIAVSVLIIAAIGIGGWQLYAQSPVQSSSNQLRTYMHQKLDYSKSLIEALAIEDYDKLSKSAQSLSLLSLESNWNILTTDEYIQQSSDFRRACRVIHEAAREKNIDRATLGFMDLTVRCVECHKYLRRNASELKAVVPASPKDEKK